MSYQINYGLTTPEDPIFFVNLMVWMKQLSAQLRMG